MRALQLRVCVRTAVPVFKYSDFCFFFFGKREKLPFCDTALDFTAQDHIFGVQYKKKKDNRDTL